MTFDPFDPKTWNDPIAADDLEESPTVVHREPLLRLLAVIAHQHGAELTESDFECLAESLDAGMGDEATEDDFLALVRWAKEAKTASALVDALIDGDVDVRMIGKQPHFLISEPLAHRFIRGLSRLGR